MLYAEQHKYKTKWQFFDKQSSLLQSGNKTALTNYIRPICKYLALAAANSMQPTQHCQTGASLTKINVIDSIKCESALF